MSSEYTIGYRVRTHHHALFLNLQRQYAWISHRWLNSKLHKFSLFVMPSEYDVEAVECSEGDVLLPPSGAHVPVPPGARPRFGALHLIGAYFAGLLTCILAYSISGSQCSSGSPVENTKLINALLMDQAAPYAGSSEVHLYPPPSPTNVYPSLFPTNVGYEGPSPTGAEPALVVTAPYYPMHTGAAELVVPKTFAPKKHGKHTNFDLLKHWGNLTPWYSVGKRAFGLDSELEAPEGCRIIGLHLLQRHGARYPTPACALSSSHFSCELMLFC